MVPKQPIVYPRGWVRAFPNDHCTIFFLKLFFIYIKNRVMLQCTNAAFSVLYACQALYQIFS